MKFVVAIFIMLIAYSLIYTGLSHFGLNTVSQG